jgi:hypothetical protein
MFLHARSTQMPFAVWPAQLFEILILCNVAMARPPRTPDPCPRLLMRAADRIRPRLHPATWKVSEPSGRFRPWNFKL